MKTISISTTAASYRFLYFKTAFRGETISLTIMKYVFKLLMYIIGIPFSEKVARRYVKKEETSSTDYFNSMLNDEYFYMKYPRYMFKKFILI